MTVLPIGIIADHATLNLGIATSTLCPLLLAFLLLWMRRQPVVGATV
ncbi:MAG: hypothetical protein WCJ56_13870 [bacterium]